MKYPVFVLICFCIVACGKDQIIPKATFTLMEVPPGYPVAEAPADNEFTLERWTLGKKLFYDNIMSADGNTSCASCHKQGFAFSDDVPLSTGVFDRQNQLNTPTLTNIAYNPYYTLAGGVSTLEKHVLVPVQEHNEFDFNMLDVVTRMNEDITYVNLSRHAYDRIPDPFVITRALACFERSLISYGSNFDRFNSGHEEAVSTSARRGLELFNSTKTGCSNCHSGINFTDYSFRNNGIYEDYIEEGRMRLTGLESDKGLFKVPTLRNIKLTAPYMHDGSMNDLEAVIRHYESGGKNFINKNKEIVPFSLNGQERVDLISFLESLTDYQFIQNPIFAK